jgi:hypothetical protein
MATAVPVITIHYTQGIEFYDLESKTAKQPMLWKE